MNLAMIINWVTGWISKPSLTDWLLVIVTFLLYWNNHRLNWITNAMQSHSDLSLKLQAKEQGIPVIWWDPKAQKLPRTPKHGDVYRGDFILSYLPPKLRGRPDSKPINVDALLRKLKDSKRSGRTRRGKQ